MARTFEVIGVQPVDRRIEEVADTTGELAHERSFETRAACEHHRAPGCGYRGIGRDALGKTVDAMDLKEYDRKILAVLDSQREGEIATVVY